MGLCVEVCVFNGGKEECSSAFDSTWEAVANNIDGELVDPLQKLVEGKKCVMIVNVATK